MDGHRLDSQSPNSDLPARRALRILLVEDHEDTLFYLSRHLENEGHEVFIARSIKEARTAIPAFSPGLMLCDITLPDGDGRSFLEELAAARPAVCIAMSGYGMNADLHRSLAAGFDHHLTKPFLPGDLDALLVNL